MTPPTLKRTLASLIAIELKILENKVTEAIKVVKNDGGVYKTVVKIPVYANSFAEMKVFDKYLNDGWHIDFINRDSSNINYRFTKDLF